MFQNQISNLSNFQGIQLETDISIITLSDNISHTYCSKIKWEKNNYSPLGVAQLIMPYSKQIESYWVKYSGAVIVHANLNSKEQSLTQAMMYNMPSTISLNMQQFQKAQEKNEEKVDVKKDKKTNKIHLKNDYYNYSFIGKVARFKQTGNTFIVYLEDLGWKFLQKVPKEFRNSFIAGQSLDDAFQAICEFMGVDFAYSIEDLGEYQFSADGYSVEKNGEVIEDVPSILKEWAAPDDEEDEEEKTEDEKMADALKDGQPFESSGLGEYKQKQNQSINQSTNQSSNSLNAQVTNQSNNQSSNQLDNQTDEQTNTTSDKIEMYQQEFDDKIKDLFIGNTLYDSNISDPILNYDWITITPKAITTTTTNTNTQTPNQDSNQETNQDTNQNNNQNNNQEANQ